MKVRACLTLFLASILFFSISIRAVASDKEPLEAKNLVSIDLAVPVVLNLAVSGGYAIPVFLDYQRVLTTHLNLSIAPSVAYLYDPSWGETLLLTMWVELDWHPFQGGFQGFFIGPAVAGLLYSDTFNNVRSGPGLVAGGAMGYQLALPANFNIDIVAGLAAGAIAGYPTLQGIPRVALALGYRF